MPLIKFRSTLISPNVVILLPFLALECEACPRQPVPAVQLVMAFTELIRSHLAKLDVQVETQVPVTAYPMINPTDVFRLYLTKALHQLSGADVSIIYPQLMRLQTLEKGDLTLAAPALRCKGAKPADQAQIWAQQVWTLHSRRRMFCTLTLNSFRRTNTSMLLL